MGTERSKLFASVPEATLWDLAQATVSDRVVGCLVGSALGDAIGLYTEFLSRTKSEAAYPSRKFKLSPADDATRFLADHHRSPHLTGEWTDDTDHAILILLSYLHKDGKSLDPTDFASRLRTWVEMGLRALDTLPLGLGRTVGTIVRKKEYLDDPERIAREVWVKGGRDVAPNGSLMRTHPLGLMSLSMGLEETFNLAASYSVVTHVDPRCVLACAVGTALVRGLVRSEVTEEHHVDDMVENAVQWYQGWHEAGVEKDDSRKHDPPLNLDELASHARAKTLADLHLDEGGKIGYVYKTFGSGILLLRLAMRRTGKCDSRIAERLATFEDLITELIMQGGDADTNACFAGALLGAYLGYNALPVNWREGLRHGDWLVGKADSLCKVLGVRKGLYKGTDDRDTFPDGGRGFLTPNQMEERFMLLQARMASNQQELSQNGQSAAKKKKLFGLFKA